MIGSGIKEAVWVPEQYSPNATSIRRGPGGMGSYDRKSIAVSCGEVTVCWVAWHFTLLHIRSTPSLPQTTRKEKSQAMKIAYGERDYSFGQTMLTLRAAIGVTQAGLADHLGISRRAVGEWEAGSSYPKTEHLKKFIALGVKQRAFTSEHEAEEIRALWRAAHQKVLLDEYWLSALLVQHPQIQYSQSGSQQTGSSTLSPVAIQPGRVSQENPKRPGDSIPGQQRPPLALVVPVPVARRVDWGDALAVPAFYGREQELTLLKQWILQEHCRIISVLGMGGIGKSALTVRVMHQLAEHFDAVIFRSLRDAPSCEVLLDDCLQVLSATPDTPRAPDSRPPGLERLISLLLEHFRTSRVLIVLDNVESILEEGEVIGLYRPGFEGYGLLLSRVAEIEQQSCLLLTSREKLSELRPLEGKYAPVRSLRLSGLDISACQQLLAGNEVVGTAQDWIRLIEIYAGNPLALKIVAQSIADLFNGEIAQFLATGTVIFGTVAGLLGDQFARLSPLEQTVLYWLALAREPVTIEELLSMLVFPLPPVRVLEALDGLRRRSLVENGTAQGSFMLQSVVLEYVTEMLILEAVCEIQQQHLDVLIHYALEQAQAKEYVRMAQERMVVAALLARVQRMFQGKDELEQQMLSLLDQLRGRPIYAQGYGPANLMALLRLHYGHLRGIDLSNLVIRGANMQGIEMQEASLAGSTLIDSVFTEALNAPWSLAISHDGEYWAAGSMQGEVHVWRRGIQTLHLIWQAHTDTTIALSFSSDGHSLATGSWDGTIKLWDLESGVLLWSGWHTRSINCVACSPNANLLASSGNDRAIRLWNSWSGENIQTLMHDHPVYALAWSPNGRLLAGGDFAGNIHVWELQPGLPARRVQVFAAHTNWVDGLAFAPDGKTLASASWDGVVKLWELSSAHLLYTLSGHTDRVNRVAWSPDGRLLASCSYDKVIWIWDVEQSSYRTALRGHSAAVYAIAFTPDGTSLLSSSEDGTLRVWDVVSGQCIHVMQGYAVSCYDIDWSPDGTQLVSVSTDGAVTICDLSGRTPPRMLRGHKWIVFGVSWSPDGRRIVSSGWDSVLRLWDPLSGACTQIIRDPDYPDLAFESVAWHPDGKLLACGTDKHGVQVWDVDARRRRWVAHGPHSVLIDDVAWSPDGAHLATTSDEGSVYLWDALDGTLLQSLPGHHGRVVSIAWSPDGRRLASCGGREGAGELFVWDMQHGERLCALEGHPGVVYAVSWGPGDLLVSGCSDGILRWWNTQSGECTQTRDAHQGTIQSLRTSPDAQRLASCGDDGAIKIWDLCSAEYLQTLRCDRPYERLNITNIQGLTAAQKITLRTLGAIEEETPSP